MQVRMMDERLTPGVKDGEEADLGAEMARVGRDRTERVGDGAEEQTVDDGLVLGGDLGDGRGHGEDDVEVLGGQQVCAAPFEPLGAGQRLAGRAVTVAARVVPHAPMAAVVTLLDVAAERGGAALLDGRHHTALRRRQDGPDLGPKDIAVAAEHFRHGERGTRHGRRSVDGLGAFCCGPREQVQRTRSRADLGDRDPQVARGGLQTPMPEQELDGAQVGAGLEEMDREGMAKRMGRDDLGETRAPGGDAAGKLDRAARDRRLRALAGGRASAAAVRLSTRRAGPPAASARASRSGPSVPCPS